MYTVGHVRSCTMVLTIALAISSSAAIAGPPGDYGDAPVGNNGENVEAYPGVLARWPSFYDHKTTVYDPQYNNGTWLNPGATFRLGLVPGPTTSDSPQNPDHPSNDCEPVILIERPGPAPIAELILTVSSSSSHMSSQGVYLNVFIDQNRDGQWKDGYLVNTVLAAWYAEWVVQDLKIDLDADEEAEIVVGGIRLESPTEDCWIRLILSDRQLGKQLRPPCCGTTFWDASMPFSHAAKGEIEDHLLEYKDSPGSGSGIYLRQSYLGRTAPGDPGGPVKPACFAGAFLEVLYDRPEGETRPHYIHTDWCPDSESCLGDGTDFGVKFEFSDWGGGCTADPDALLGLYGYKYKEGVKLPPSAPTRLPDTDFSSNNVALDCTSGTPSGPLPNGDKPYDWLDGGRIPVSSISGDTASKQWNACYQSGPKCRWRLYGARALVRSCGCEVQAYSVNPSPMIISDLSIVEDAGAPVEVLFGNGRLLENVVDPNGIAPLDPNQPFDPNNPSLGRPFPDPDFPGSADPGNPTSASLDSEQYVSPPYALKFVDDDYNSEPGIADCVVRARQLRFWHRYKVRNVEIVARTGQRLYFDEDGVYNYADPQSGVYLPIPEDFGFLDPNFSDPDPFSYTVTPTPWRHIAINIPQSFDLDVFYINMEYGWIDDIEIILGRVIDCNGNCINDADDIARGRSIDCNGNGWPDECDIELYDPNGPFQSLDLDGDGVPDECSVPAGDTCASAIAVSSLPYTDSGSTAGMMHNYNEDCNSVVGGRDVVYEYTPVTDQSVNIDLCSSLYDTLVYVYAIVCPDSGNAIACNNNACGSQSRISDLQLYGGETYYIVVDGSDPGSDGAYTLRITESSCLGDVAGAGGCGASDGTIDLTDLGCLLGDYGTPSVTGIGDIGGIGGCGVPDGNTDLTDLGCMLRAYGPCP